MVRPVLCERSVDAMRHIQRHRKRVLPSKWWLDTVHTLERHSRPAVLLSWQYRYSLPARLRDSQYRYRLHSFTGAYVVVMPERGMAVALEQASNHDCSILWRPSQSMVWHVNNCASIHVSLIHASMADSWSARSQSALRIHQPSMERIGEMNVKKHPNSGPLTARSSVSTSLVVICKHCGTSYWHLDQCGCIATGKAGMHLKHLSSDAVVVKPMLVFNNAASCLMA